MIPNADLERFIHPPLAGVDVVIRALAFADHIEGIAGIHADGLVLGRVVNRVLAYKFKMSVRIAAIEPQLAFG